MFIFLIKPLTFGGSVWLSIFLYLRLPQQLRTLHHTCLCLDPSYRHHLAVIPMHGHLFGFLSPRELVLLLREIASTFLSILQHHQGDIWQLFACYLNLPLFFSSCDRSPEDGCWVESSVELIFDWLLAARRLRSDVFCDPGIIGAERDRVLSPFSSGKSFPPSTSTFLGLPL